MEKDRISHDLDETSTQQVRPTELLFLDARTFLLIKFDLAIGTDELDVLVSQITIVTLELTLAVRADHIEKTCHSFFPFSIRCFFAPGSPVSYPGPPPALLTDPRMVAPMTLWHR